MKTMSFNYPEYAEIDGEKYKINTDFRIAIKCNELTLDKDISEEEKIKRCMEIIFLLFGEKGLRATHHYKELSEKAIYYLRCGSEENENINNNEKPDMDFVEDTGYIASSFQYDYKYNPYEMENVHWWKFYNDLNNLSNSELGNCCVLNRVRNLRSLNLNDIKDSKTRDELRKAKKSVALKRYQQKKKEATEEQKKSAEEFYKALGIGKE